MKSAIAGCGTIAQLHGRVLTDWIDTSLVGAADIDDGKARAYAETWHTNAYTSLEEMLCQEQPDVLHICTPHYLHVPMAEYALAQGIHVFMEKPPVISREQLYRLQQAVKNSGARLGLCYQNRYNPSIRTALHILSSGKAGKILGARGIVTWHRDSAYYTDSGWRGKLAAEGGGVLINQAVHTMDLLQYLLGRPLAVEASMANHHLKSVIEVEDTMEAFIRFEGNINASFYATTAYCADVPPLIEVACEHMTIRIEEMELTLLYPDGRREKPRLEHREALGKSYWGTGHRDCISDFYHALQTGSEFPLNLQNMEASIRLMLAAYESAESGQVVRVDNNPWELPADAPA